jgi:sporulation protein YlmC with PRC-barrel domain
MDRKSIVALAGLLVVSAAALAQTEAPTPTPGPADAQTAPMAPASGLINEQAEGQMLVSDYMGADVLDANGEQIGDISDLILDEQHKVVGFVIATGGFLGVGAHNVGVALGDLTVSTDPKGFTIATSREELEAAPEFKTLAAIEAEREAQMLQQQQQQQPPTTPAPQPPAQ